MNRSEAVQEAKKLKRIAKMKTDDLDTWLALVEDELRSVVPDSRLLERFMEIKEKAKPKLTTQSDPKASWNSSDIQSSCRYLIAAVCERLSSAPFSGDELTDEVERIIQVGYFKSIWFRAVVGGLALVLLLVTGIEGYKLNEQVKAMQKLVEEARRQVEEGRLQVAKASAESSESQAKLGLLILQGNADLVKLQTQAATEMANQEMGFNAKVAGETQRWTDQIAKKDGPEASKKVIDAGDKGAQTLSGQVGRSSAQMEDDWNKGKAALAQHLASAISSLDSAKNPWVPRAVWSIAGTWLMVPVSLVIVLLTWVHTFTQRLPSSKTKWNNILSIVNIFILLAVFVFVCSLKYGTSDLR